MNPHQAKALQRLEEYCKRKKIAIEKQLGSGVDGVVWSTNRPPAIKTLYYESLYVNERDVYKRLEAHGYFEVLGFSIPRLLDYHDELFIVEMEIVTPPFVVDFAGASLDEPQSFPEEIMESWENERRELFEDDWPTVKSLMSAFRRIGVYLNDVKPGNVTMR